MGESVQYLGHIIDRQGVRASNDKLKAILNAPDPTNINELHPFLGLLNYYHKFIPCLASVLGPLNELLKSNSKWSWSKDHARAFWEAKNGWYLPKYWFILIPHCH